MTICEVGKTYVFFVPPSWILGGTVVEVSEAAIKLKDAVYLEMAGDGRSVIGDVALATTPKGQKAACTASWPLPDGMIIRLDAALLVMPCARDLTPLSRDAAAKALAASR